MDAECFKPRNRLEIASYSMPIMGERHKMSQDAELFELGDDLEMAGHSIVALIADCLECITLKGCGGILQKWS